MVGNRMRQMWRNIQQLYRQRCKLISGGKILKRYDKGVYSEDEVIADINELKNNEK